MIGPLVEVGGAMHGITGSAKGVNINIFFCLSSDFITSQKFYTVHLPVTFLSEAIYWNRVC